MATSNVIFHQAYKDKVIEYNTEHKRFECAYCVVKLSGEESAIDHLHSKTHREVGARYAITNLTKSPPSIKGLLSDVVKTAAEAGDISVKDSKDILCHVCNLASTGVVSLEAHLASRNHNKKKKDLTITDSDITQAVRDKIAINNNPNELHCTECDLRFNGEHTLKQHLSSAKHEEACAKLAISDITRAPRHLVDRLPEAVRDAARREIVMITDSKRIKCNTCDVTVAGVTDINNHLVGSEHRKKSMSIFFSNDVSPADRNGVSSDRSSNATATIDPPVLHSRTHPEIAEAMKEGIIDEMDSIKGNTDNVDGKFSCKCCNKYFNNAGPLLDHLKSKKHLIKRKSFLESQSTTNTPAPLEIEVSPVSSLPSTLTYSVISDVRGHVYVFNYSFRGTASVRNGAEHDSSNLKEIFTKMGYEVFIYEDLTGEETINRLESIRKKPQLNEIDSFIMFFLSHGLDPYTFLANDKEELDLRDLRRKFTDRRCPYLRGKPKIFMVNYCRGDQLQKKDVVEFDAIEVPNDMVTIHAATEGIMAKRTQVLGTIFVASLCDVLKSYAHDLDLRTIYNILDMKMKENRGTKPMWEDYGFKTFHFNPTNS